MAELDFSKIFGETATSKASFTDENYLNGWGYLGSTPPPYQLFDYLQSKNDKKAKYLYDKTIENNNKLALHNTDANAHADIRAKITSDINSHNTNATAHTDIRAKITSDINSHNTNATAHTAILNAIKAISGMDDYNTAPSMSLASMIPLLGLGGIVAQSLGTNSYVEFANGIIIQKGILPSTGIPSGSKINLIIPMKDYQVFMSDDYAKSDVSNPLAYSVDHWTSNTYFTAYGIRVKTTSTSLYGSWLAIGWSV